ncbi:hypothetical protein D1007_18061 [Hordeum vulgare]|uniref:Uncharacterized protein n=1 Tax=Hordeum vulgare subsp. vulgare TaxID=112509 RepID=A0A8I6XWY2_HORVV|nr:uncharacterized protein LOC123452509 [Hordeum vulgare subsp. vulgare]KAE8805903.1 hypothetical protein D1007_18061 [Hordeum vulgare]KAI4985219.1 hypothetical protein ZWY2020_017849 [Hordeum vulgare]
MMRLLPCFCVCFVVLVLVGGSSPADPRAERCPLHHRRQLEDGGGGSMQATAVASKATAVRPPQEIADLVVYGTSKRLSPGGSNPQHHH